MAAQTCGTRPIYIEPWKPRGDYLQNGDDVRLKRKAGDKNGVALGLCRTTWICPLDYKVVYMRRIET